MANPDTSRGSTERAALAAIIIIAAAARLAAITQPMRFDEAISWAYFVGRSWGTIVTSYTYPNNHVLYSLLAKLTGSPFAYQPWALRIPAFLFGVAVVSLTWSVGRRFADERTGLLGAALVAGSAELTLFSTNARGYTLVVACFLALILLADDLRQAPTAKRFAAFALVGGLGVYAVPTTLYPLGSVVLWLLLASRGMEAGRRFRFQLAMTALCAGVIAALLYAPIIASAGADALLANKFVTPSRWSQFATDLPRMIRPTIAEWMSPLPYVAAFVLVALAVVGVLRHRDNTRPSLAVAAAVWCGALLLVTHRVPFVRVWIFMVPLFHLAVARGFWWCADRVPGGTRLSPPWTSGVVAAALALLMATRHSVQRSEDTGLFAAAPSVTERIKPLLRSGDRILAPIPSNGPLLYYFDRAGLDTSSLSVPFESTRRIFLVLDLHHGINMAWAVEHGLIDSEHFAPPDLVMQTQDTEVWMANRR